MACTVWQSLHVALDLDTLSRLVGSLQHHSVQCSLREVAASLEKSLSGKQAWPLNTISFSLPLYARFSNLFPLMFTIWSLFTRACDPRQQRQASR
jgi:hypothetical protein